MERKRDIDKYFEGYKKEEITTPNGRKKVIRVYRGDYYSFDIQGSDLKRMRRSITGCLVLSAMLYLGLWVLPVGAAYSVIVVAVMAVTVFPLLYCFMGLFSFLTAKAPFVARYTYYSLPRLQTGSRILRVCSLCLCGVYIIYLILSQGAYISYIAAEIAFPALGFLMFLLACRLVRLTGSISFVNLGKTGKKDV